MGKDKDPKTEKAIRDVEITPGMMEALKRQKTISYLAHSYVFMGDKGLPIDVSNFRVRIWETAIKKAGLKYRYPYQARYTFATKYLGKGKLAPSKHQRSKPIPYCLLRQISALQSP
ncbi:MAG: hypothetical protein O7B35_00740 [Deltaproteobacteria bacterium]|nr:hypothetical protein [Deltaproteobacteria bacterium]